MGFSSLSNYSYQRKQQCFVIDTVYMAGLKVGDIKSVYYDKFNSII